MDDFIHDPKKGLALYVRLGVTNLWVVKTDEEPIALFALSKGVLRLSTSDRPILEAQGLTIEEEIFSVKETYPSIEIDYLAVNHKYKNLKIGTFLIDTIAERAKADTLSATMFLTVEAIDTKEYSAVNFYRKCDFKDSEQGITRNQNMRIYGNESSTRRMYRPLYKA